MEPTARLKGKYEINFVEEFFFKFHPNWLEKWMQNKCLLWTLNIGIVMHSFLKETTKNSRDHIYKWIVRLFARNVDPEGFQKMLRLNPALLPLELRGKEPLINQLPAQGGKDCQL